MDVKNATLVNIFKVSNCIILVKHIIIPVNSNT